MNRMKYVVILDSGLETIIMFPGTMSHKQFKQLSTNIISAGFVSPSTSHPCGFRCFGESDSLALKCRGEQDQRLLNSLMRRDDL